MKKWMDYETFIFVNLGTIVDVCTAHAQDRKWAIVISIIYYYSYITSKWQNSNYCWTARTSYDKICSDFDLI